MGLGKKIEKVKFEDDIQVCWCSREQSYKPCSEFSKRNDGREYQYYCKDCYIYTQSKDYVPIPVEEVKKGSDELLTKIGYDLQSPLSIHQQFLIKHFNDRI